MTLVTLVYTGPLVAMCDRTDSHHKWTVAALGSITGALTTCEAVLTEVCFLLKRNYGRIDAIFDLLDQDLLCVDFDFASEHRRVQQLMNRYADLPASLADACLVRMTELIPNSRVMTLDRDFTVYRRHGRQAIPLLSPCF